MFLLLVLLSFNLFAQDEYLGQQWYLHNTGEGIKRDIDEITSRFISGIPGKDVGFPFDLTTAPTRPVVVAILDTGVDIDHPELKSSIAREPLECDRVGNLPPRSAPDKDQNGFSGDCAGWNFASAQHDNGDNQVWDDVGHGTHLAGLIAAKADGHGIRGLSDKIKILPVKIFGKYEIPNHPKRPKLSMMKRIVGGLKYAIEKNVDVINLSLGWPKFLDSPEVRELIALARKKNILLVAAAGNNAHHTTIYPCSYETILCVGATTVNGERAPFSNFGGNVDLMAPGEHILSTVPRKVTPLYFDEDGYDYKNGTSQAAPLVAGAAALIKLVYPDITVKELKARLFHSAGKTKGPLDSLFGSLNITRALTEAPGDVSYPEFKELNTVTVSYPKGEFSFSVPLISLSGPLGEPKLTLPETTFEAELEGSVLKVRGTIRSFQMEATKVLRLKLGEREFSKEITFALDPYSLSQRLNFETKVEGVRTVDDPFMFARRDLFYVQSPSRSFDFYRFDDGQYRRILSFEKAEDLKPVSFTFLAPTLVSFAFFDGPNKKLIYELWSFEEDPRLLKTLTMVPDSAVWELGKAAYLGLAPLKAANIAVGVVPLLERANSVFLPPENGKAVHAYFFKEENGEIKTYLLDTKAFRKDMVQRYKLRFDDEIAPISLETVGATKHIHVRFSLGKGFERRLIEVAFSDRDKYEVVKEERLAAAFAFKSISFLGNLSFLAQEKRDAYLSFEDGRLKRYPWDDENDDLLGPIGHIAPGLLLAQSQNHFAVMTESGILHKVPLKRFSFLPGELFSEMFVPVTIRQEGYELPALFVDATLISERHVSVVTWNGEKLLRPVFFQQTVPAECQVLNPQKLSEDFSISFVCQKENTTYILRRNLSYL